MFYPIISFLISIWFSVQTPNDLIDWSASRKLKWEDFKGDPDPTSSNAALTSSNIKVAFGYNHSQLQYSIQCRFDKNHSWAKMKNDYILAHEQGHFDIAELHARLLNKALKEYTFKSKTVGEDVNNIYDQIMQQHHNFQLQYDKETDHSRNPATQAEWEKKIRGLLAEYSKYSDYHYAN
jgi:hypothetical protein